MQLFLERTVSGDNGTFGTLTMQDENSAIQQLCLTCELPWKNNFPGESCIPTGTYDCIPHHSEKFPNTWEVTGVRGRSAILIHIGNTIRDTEGCILVGDKFGIVHELPAVLNSRVTMGMLRSILPPKFTLTIQ